ncbi:MAG: flagellar hook-associated protein FlgL [Pseudomonadota bacterium]
MDSIDSRISSSVFFNQGLSGMSNAQAGIAKAMEEISSGRRDIRASNDPVAAASIVDLGRSVSRLEQYQRNADFAEARHGLTENALQSITEVLNRAREVAIQFNSGGQSDVSRNALRSELGQLRDQLLSELNTQDERGDYIFSGSRVKDKPYSGATATFLGGAAAGTPLAIEVAEGGRQVQAGWIASGFEGVLQALNDMADPAGPNTVDTARFDTIVQASDQAMLMRTEVGGAMRAVELARTDNEGELYGYTTALSSLRDTDYPSAITELNKHTLLLQATQSTMAKVQGLSLFNEI